MYHVIAVFIFLFSLISIYKDDIKNNNNILAIIIFGLFVLSSIRYYIGTDYGNYYNFFESIKPFGLDSNYGLSNQYFEPLFQYIVSILKHIIEHPVFYFSFYSFITLLFLFLGIKKESEHYIISAFILYCIFYHHYLFNTIRQGVVMGIFIYSTTFIINRSLIKVLLISFLSSLIHTSGWLILVAYFSSFIKIKSRLTLLILLLVSISVWQVGLGEKLFIFLINVFNNFIPANLNMYVKLFSYDHSFTQVLQRLLVAIPLIYYYPILSDSDRFSKLFSIYLFGLVFYLIFGFFGLFIARINMFFRILEILLIPILYQKLKTKNQKLVVQFCIMIWCFTILSWVYYKDTYYPFKTIFDNLF